MRRVLAVMALSLALGLAGGALRTRCEPDAMRAPHEAALSPHLGLGRPVDADPSDDWIILRPTYALSYNRERHGANWVAWKLDAADLGMVDYGGPFRPDPDLPREEQVTRADYEHSGFDIGHLCPAADRGATDEAHTSTFLLGNALPQRPALNRGPWEALEKYTRQLVQRGSRAFVTAGPLWGDHPATLGRHAVPVPASFWKVVVEVCSGCGAGAVEPGTHVVAVIMPNEEHVGHRWATYQTTMREVEHRSGYRLLGMVPDEVHDRLATKIDGGDR